MGYEAIKKLNVRQSGYISNIRDDVEDNKKRWRPRYNILLLNFSLAETRWTSPLGPVAVFDMNNEG